MRRRLLLFAAASLLVIALAWLLRDLVREAVVVPILYLWGLVRFIADVIPQMPVWAVFLVIVLLLALRSLGLKAPTLDEDRKSEEPRRGRVGFWVRRLKLASQGHYSRWRLARELGDLSVDMLAQRGRTSPDQVRQELRDGNVPAPPDVRRYLQAAVSTKSHRDFATFSAGANREPLGADVARVVEFLEAQLEVEVQERAEIH